MHDCALEKDGCLLSCVAGHLSGDAIPTIISKGSGNFRGALNQCGKGPGTAREQETTSLLAMLTSNAVILRVEIHNSVIVVQDKIERGRKDDVQMLLMKLKHVWQKTVKRSREYN